MRITKINSAYLYAGLAILCWSTVSTAFKLSLRYLEPIQLLLWSSAISTIVILGVVLFQGRIAQLYRIKPTELKHSALLGFLNPFLYYAVLLEAYDRLPAQEAQALNYIWAVMIVLLSVPILHKKLTFKDLMGVLVSFVGAVVIANRGHSWRQLVQMEEPLGVGLALLSTLIWALFWLYNVRDKRDAVIKLFWNFLLGFSFILLYTVISGKFTLPGFPALWGAIYIGIFEMGITFVFWLLALSKAENTARVTNLIFITPFLSLLIISRVLGEKITAATLIGLAMIIAGILWQQLTAAKIETAR